MSLRPLRLAPLVAGLALVLAGCGDDVADTLGGGTETITVEIGTGPNRSGDEGDAAPTRPAGEPPQVPGDEACDGARAPITAERTDAAERTLVCLTNAVRRREGLGELATDDRLARAASDRSQAMAQEDYFGHDGPGDSTVTREVRDTGWVPSGESWLVGENIAAAPRGAATPARIMRGWLDSPSHRENILNEHFAEIGIGVVAAMPSDRPAGATVTQVFGVTGPAARAAQTR